MSNINFSVDNQQFNYRVTGVVIRDSKILLHKIGDNTVWSLPGGRCELGEDSESAVAREFMEEMGEKVKVIRPIYLMEYFFAAWGKDIHELSINYLVEFEENSEILKTEEFLGKEGKKKILFKWFDLAELEQINFQPSVLKKKFQKIPDSLERIMDRVV